MAEKSASRAKRVAPTIDDIASGIASIPWIRETYHVRSEALFVVQVRGVGKEQDE